jgi:hypothetical protein
MKTLSRNSESYRLSTLMLRSLMLGFIIALLSFAATGPHHSGTQIEGIRKKGKSIPILYNRHYGCAFFSPIPLLACIDCGIKGGETGV